MTIKGGTTAIYARTTGINWVFQVTQEICHPQAAVLKLDCAAEFPGGVRCGGHVK